MRNQPSSAPRGHPRAPHRPTRERERDFSKLGAFDRFARCRRVDVVVIAVAVTVAAAVAVAVAVIIIVVRRVPARNASTR